MAADFHLNHSCHAHESCAGLKPHVLLFVNLYSALVLETLFACCAAVPFQLGSARDQIPPGWSSAL
jgi:hypothetical protein